VNPADAPIMILSLTSESMTRGQMYDAASSILAQKLSQLKGIGQVFSRRQFPAGGTRGNFFRPRSTSTALARKTCVAPIAAANANRPKGMVEDGVRHWQIYANDQARQAAEYLPLIHPPTATAPRCICRTSPK